MKMLLLGEGKAQAKIEVPVVGGDVVAKRSAAVPRIAAPAAPTVHAVCPTRSTGRIGMRTAAIFAIPVLAPFPDIAAHVVDAKFIGLLCAYGMCLAAAISIIPCYRPDIVAATVFIPSAPVASTGSILPLCLGGQAELHAGKLVQFADKVLAIIPTNLFNWQIISLKI